MAIDLPSDVEERLDPWERGYLEGLAAYAWWSDGVQQVGTTGTTLRQASARFLRARGHEIPEVRP